MQIRNLKSILRVESKEQDTSEVTNVTKRQHSNLVREILEQNYVI